jgi:hypothetical protein
LREKDGYFEAARAAATRINQYLETNGFPSRVTVPSDLPVEYSLDGRYGERVAILDKRNSPVEFRFSLTSKEILRFTNYTVYGTNERLYKEKPQPTWPTEKAVSVAEGFVRALLGEFPKSLSLVKAEYYWPTRNPPYYYEGEWFLEWARRDSEGHLFAGDRVIVRIIEAQGPYLASIELVSNYEEKGLKPIAKETAIEKALPAAKEIMNCPAVGGWFAGLSITGAPLAELRIVNPNHITHAKSLEEIGHGDQKARLAWVVTYPVKYAGPPQSGPVPTSGDVEVWIDAETGEFLGGDGK